MFRRKNSKKSNDPARTAPPSEPGSGPEPQDARPKRPKATLRPESLEDRILLSGTWVDADSGEAIAGPTDGADAFTGDELADIVEAGAGDDILLGGGGNDFLDGEDGDDVVAGGDGDDVVAGDRGSDTLSGGEGDDLIVGGQGIDTVDFSEANGAVDVDLGAETATGEGSDTIIGVENVIGSSKGDSIVGDGHANVIDGGGGHDTIIGGGGDDTLTGGHGRDTIEGGAGRDVISGGTGNDTLRGGAGDDMIEGGSGRDNIDAGAGDDTIVAGSGNDSIEGGAGFDTLDYSGAGGPVQVNLASGSATGSGNDTISGIERIVGSSAADSLTGGNASETLEGGQGDDTLSGGAGDDTLIGGQGRDTLVGGAGADTLEGGVGDDTFIADEADTISGGAGEDTADFSDAGSGVRFDASEASVEHVTGSAHDDVFSFAAAVDGDVYTVDGGGGYNVLNLSDYDHSSLDIDTNAGVIVVDLGGGEQFQIEFENIDHLVVDGLDHSPALHLEPIVGGESSHVQVGAIGLSSTEAPISYSWTQVSGPVVALHDADTRTPAFDTPELSADTTIRFEVEVSNEHSSSIQAVTIGISANNDPLVLNAGPDQIVSEGDAVTLAASSIDPEGKPVSYEWTQVGGPAVELSGADSESPTFEAPNMTDDAVLTFEVSASDGEHVVTSTVSVVVQATDDAALVDAGLDFTVEEGQAVQLGASALDPEGQALTYQWVQTGGPTVALSGSDGPSPTFEAPEGLTNTELTFQVTVNDGASSSTDSVTVTVEANDDRPSITSAPNHVAGEHEAVQLVAHAEDPEGGGLTYSWQQVGGPAVTLSDEASPSPTFTTPESISNTYLTFEVSVSDGTSTTVDTVDVLVNATNDAPVVSASSSATIEGGSRGTLSASASDPEGRAVVYQWTQVGGPTASMSNANQPEASFRAPSVDDPTVLTFQVAVTDGETTTYDTVFVAVEPEPEQPAHDDGESPESNGGSSGAVGPLSLAVEAPSMLEAIEGDLVSLEVDVSNATGDVTYTWTQTAGSQAIVFDGADTASPSFTAPEQTENEIYLFEVNVQDDTGSKTVEVAVRLTADNDGPSVEIDEVPSEVSTGVFDIGSSATDPEGQNLSYRWVQVGGPSVNMFESDTASLRFSTSQLTSPADVTFELQVSDGSNITTELVTFAAEPGNEAPLVSAGNDQTVTEGDTVTLSSAASDPNEDELTYRWVQTGGPTVTLSDPTAASPTFDAPNLQDDATITFELTVSDGSMSASDSVSVVVEAVNDPPTVDAGPFQSVQEGDTVVLGATGQDVDSTDLTYAWTQVGGPEVTLDGSDTQTPTFTAPEDVTNTYLTFEVQASDGETTVVDRVMILVNADNDAPTISAGPDFAAPERSTVTLHASATDPEGQPLTHTWTQTGGPEIVLDDVNSLSPSFNAPDVLENTELTFQVTTTDGTHTSVDTVTVTIEGENDAPTATNSTSTLLEDTEGTITLSGVDQDLTDGVEHVRIDALPDHGVLKLNGVAINAGDVIDSADVASGALTFEPASNWSGTTSLQFSVSDGDAWSDSPGTQFITVTGQADAPLVSAAPASGVEDSPIALTVDVQLTDTDGSESIRSVRVTGAPAGSVFTDGVTTVTAWNGSADISALDLDSLSVIPGADHDQDFVLTFSATAEDAQSGHTSVGAATLAVHVDGVNDPPVPQDTTMVIQEDTTAVVNLHAIELDTGDAIETYRIDTLPSTGTLALDGVAVTAGQEISAHDVLTGSLTFTPDADSDADVSFEFSASDGEVWSTQAGTFAITVEAVADSPIVSASDVYIQEDGTASLDLAFALSDTDGSESISAVTIDGAPVGTIFSDGVHSSMNLGEPVDITEWDLDNLTISPTPNYEQDFELIFQVTAQESESGHETTTEHAINVHVTAVNDAPVVQAGSMTLNEDASGSVRLEALELDYGDAVEQFRIDHLPEHGLLTLDGAAVSEGQLIEAEAVADGRLEYAPPSDWSGSTEIRFSAFDGEAWSSTQGEFEIAVQGVADAADLVSQDASGTEDHTIALDIDAALTDVDGSESLSITISGVPEGASLSAGTDEGDGTWRLMPNQLDGLTFTPPADADGTFQLTVTATTQDGSDSTSVSQTIDVDVEGVADAIELDVANAQGQEDTAIALDIDAALTDMDGSESLSITISGVPEGASLSAGTDTGDGVWQLTPSQLDGLTITPPVDADGDFTLTVTATATEASGDTNELVQTLDVSVDAVADAATLNASDAAGVEDQPIALDIDAALVDDDGSESMTITISGVPEGATLSHGSDEGGGIWRLEPDQLDGLTITPAADSDESFSLLVTATTTELDGDSTSVSQTIDVDVEGVADAIELEAANAQGQEDTAIALDIDAALTDTDGSESLSITISGVPEGASLSAGTDEGDGTWRLQPDQLDGLTITPAADSDENFTLLVTARTTELDGDSTSISQNIDVDVEGVADAPVLDTAASSGQEDSDILLAINTALTDTDGSESLSITISGVPEGASLSAGTDTGDGVWQLTPSQLSGLTMTPPSDAGGNIELTITATSQEANGQVAESQATLLVAVEATSDTPTLDVVDATGRAGDVIELSVSAALTDTDGSESLRITIAGVPNGAALSAGVDQGGGTWLLEPDDLDGLALRAPDDGGVFKLEVVATSMEASGGAAQASAILEVTVSPPELAETVEESSAPNEPADAPVSARPHAMEPAPEIETPEVLDAPVDADPESTPAPVIETPDAQSVDARDEPIVPVVPDSVEPAIEPNNESPETPTDSEPSRIDTASSNVEDLEPSDNDIEPNEIEPEATDGQGPRPLVPTGDEPDASGEESPWSEDLVQQVEQMRDSVESITLNGSAAASGSPLSLLDVLAPTEPTPPTMEVVPPPGEPLYEFVEGPVASRQDRAGDPDSGFAPASNTSEDEASRSTSDTKESQNAGAVLGMLWSLVRSIGGSKQDRDR